MEQRWIWVLGLSLCLFLTGCDCRLGGVPQTTEPDDEVPDTTTDPQKCEVIVVFTPEPRNFCDKIDIFFLFDDTGSFEAVSPVVREFLGGLVDAVQGIDGFENVDFAFGVGRFEDYGGPGQGFTANPTPTPTGSVNDLGDSPASRPFILNLPITSPNTANFITSIQAALAESPQTGLGSAKGGDLPEAFIEALWQVATGAGFDGNGDGNTDTQPDSVLATGTLQGATTDSVTLASNASSANGAYVGSFLDLDGEFLDVDNIFIQTYDGTTKVATFRPLLDTGVDETQPEPDSAYAIRAGETGDVPAFDGGTDQGGVGWREGSCRIVLLAADNCPVTVVRDTTAEGNGDFPATITGNPFNFDFSVTVDVEDIACPTNSTTVPDTNANFFENFGTAIVLGDSRFGFERQSPHLSRNEGLDPEAVAPFGAAKLQATIDKLNERNVLVVGLTSRVRSQTSGLITAFPAAPDETGVRALQVISILSGAAFGEQPLVFGIPDPGTASDNFAAELGEALITSLQTTLNNIPVPPITARIRITQPTGERPTEIVQGTVTQTIDRGGRAVWAIQFELEEGETFRLDIEIIQDERSRSLAEGFFEVTDVEGDCRITNGETSSLSLLFSDD